MATLPDVVRYEVYERLPDGTLTGRARGMSSDQEAAQKQADEWTAEARERHEAESGNPFLKARGITPDPPRTYAVVKVTEIREVL